GYEPVLKRVEKSKCIYLGDKNVILVENGDRGIMFNNTSVVSTYNGFNVVVYDRIQKKIVSTYGE
nr:hypothetical protein [Lachnospiraceae bacterium]